MDFKSILVEHEDKATSSVVASSAILIGNKYAITTSNLINDHLRNNKRLFSDIQAGNLHLNKKGNIQNFRVIWKTEEENVLVSKKADLFALFKCRNTDAFCKREFRDWTVDFKENNFEVKRAVSVFLILAVDSAVVSEDELKSMLRNWWINTSDVHLEKGDKISCMSCPFGTRNFLNSLSKGIVSNVLSNTILLSDCPCAPGSEGGLIYSEKCPSFPVGIVICSLNWWRKETLIASIRTILSQIVGQDLKSCSRKDSFQNKVLSAAENSVAQINCGVSWGTCILLSKEKGIFITNSHVVDQNRSINIYWKKNVMSGTLIYKNEVDSVYDLAIVECLHPQIRLMSACVTIPAAFHPGDIVYGAGYPLLSTLSTPDGPTITHGIISTSSPFMIKTTCGVFPGFSGGAILNSDGVLLGIIVCNTRLTDIDVTYPRFNMAVPYSVISNCIADYLTRGDVHVLTKMQTSDISAIRMWMSLEAKL